MKIITRLLNSRSGNFGITTALIIAVLVGVVGLAINVNTALARRDQLQQVADAAALAAASSGSNDAQQLRQKADAYFLSQAESKLGSKAAIADFTYNKTTRRIALTATSDVPVFMGGGLLPSSFPVSVLSEAEQGQGTKIEVALVLDTTASMAGQKMTDLKAAANAMLDVFENSKKDGQDVKFSLTVFANDVNLGKNNYKNEKWLAIPDPWVYNYNDCSRQLISKSGCTIKTCTWNNDGTPISYQCEECTNYVYGPETCTPRSYTYYYDGCVGSRQTPNDTKDNFASFSMPVPGVHDQCTGRIPELIPLTDNLTKIRQGVNAMTPYGETYISPGILWGWYTLSPQEPFTEGAAYSPTVRKFVVVMTDGTNTRSPADPNSTWGTHHWGGDTNAANQNMTETCNNAKKDGIVMYTVTVGIANSETDQRLEACATDKPMHYAMDNSDQLVEAFEEIALQMQTPRLVR